MKRISMLAACLVISTSTLRAEERAHEGPSASEKDSLALAATIDKEIAAVWKEKSITPAAQTSDAEFVRRLYLDLNGHVPIYLSVSSFIDNPSKEKRWKLVKELLQSERFSIHFAAVWRETLLGQSNAQFQ